MPPGSNILLDFLLQASITVGSTSPIWAAVTCHAVQGLLDHQAPPATHPNPSTHAV
jgi:hypothetical protein